MIECDQRSIEARLMLLEDKEAIRDILHRYARAADRCDAAAMKACYWPDGIDDHGFFGGSAHAYADYVIPVLQEIESCIHQISNEIIEIDGTTAISECHWQVLHRLRKGRRFIDCMHEGRYLDKFEKRGGIWKIHTRATIYDCDRVFEVADFRGVVNDIQRLLGDKTGHLDPNMQGKRYPDDIVFRGSDFSELVNGNRETATDLWDGFYKLAPILRSSFRQHLFHFLSKLRRPL